MNTTIHQTGTRVTAVTPAGHAITGRVDSHVQVNEFGDAAYTVRDDATGFTFTAAADKVQAVAPSTGMLTGGAGDCNGTGWVILNPNWPSGDLPYRDRCGGCDRCEPED